MADIWVTDCRGCGKGFLAARPDRVWCSHNCRNKHYKRFQRGVGPDIRGRSSRFTGISREDRAWVAGIVEGEGSIGPASLSHGRLGKTPRLRVGMTDEDIVYRLHDITGLGRVTGPTRSPSRAKHKPVWAWNVASKGEWLTLIGAIWPYLGQRRREQVRFTVAAWRAEPSRIFG